MTAYSEKIKELTRNYEEKVNECRNSMNGLSKYSDEEISKRRTAMLKDLDSVTADYNKQFGEILQQFLTAYAIELPDDGKDHALDISNALQIISLLGHNLDTKNLDNIIKPMVKDFKSVKTVCDLILTKSAAVSAIEAAYNTDVVTAVLDYSGANNGLSDYVERFELIKDIGKTGAKYGYKVEGALTSKVIGVRPNTSYNVMAIPQMLDDTTEMYNNITNGEFFHR